MEDYKELRDALTAGPATGPWLWAVDLDGLSVVASGTQWVANTAYGQATARYIAAANTTTITELLAELDALREDAERWRWLRSKPKGWSIQHDRFGWLRTYGADNLDAAIDAARKDEQ